MRTFARIPTKITSTREDYLRAIYSLGLGLEVKPIEISRYLKLSKQTVTERLQELSKNGLVNYKRYRSVSLTAKGLKIAQRLTYKHRVIESFLYILLKHPKNKVHEEAHRLEHAFSDKSIKALYKLLGKPKSDPHGSKINYK